ncbi:MAG: LON peptidase substrate-binding domain-containing protein [Hyphomicrobiales bacterium]|nr:LON peptidase substrate-binding domain-containing protein [Hyphomicrobiales bacterium]MDE2016929.1 LON peptidase substrate-binding domain-containing protein [Hyphomicrobiales bacterium]
MPASYRSPADVAAVVPVFPLEGALLLPRRQLPLNVFEPRYLAMVDDALKSHRLIAVAQPAPDAAEGAPAPALVRVGCVGRVGQFAETDDGRYLVVLNGIARCKIVSEVATLTPYRLVRVDCDAFAEDFREEAGADTVDRGALLAALRGFVAKRGLEIDWKSVEEASNEALVNGLAMVSPFGPREKQALLEAPDLRTRAEALVAMAEIEADRRAPGGARLQ